MKSEKCRWIIGGMIVVLTLLFIWNNSLESVEVSAAKSSAFEAFINRLMGLYKLPFDIRKAAHFVEFCLLGVELKTLLLITKRLRLQSVTNILFLGLAAGTTDEALQLISNRGSSVKDVLLDFTGFSTGLVLIIFTYGLVQLRKRRKRGIHVCRN